MLSFASYIAAALLAWGAVNPPIIATSSHSVPSGPQATAGLLTDGSCHIDVYGPGWAAMNETARQRLISHEVGHCLGLDHYGDCNTTPAIMGCAPLYDVTAYDRLRYQIARGSASRVVIPALAVDDMGRVP